MILPRNNVTRWRFRSDCSVREQEENTLPVLKKTIQITHVWMWTHDDEDWRDVSLLTATDRPGHVSHVLDWKWQEATDQEATLHIRSPPPPCCCCSHWASEAPTHTHTQTFIVFFKEEEKSRWSWWSPCSSSSSRCRDQQTAGVSVRWATAVTHHELCFSFCCIGTFYTQ